jgi:hypothetical protein
MKRNQYLVCYERGFIKILHKSTKEKCIAEGVKFLKRMEAEEHKIKSFKQALVYSNNADDMVVRIVEFE